MASTYIAQLASIYLGRDIPAHPEVSRLLYPMADAGSSTNASNTDAPSVLDRPDRLLGAMLTVSTRIRDSRSEASTGECFSKIGAGACGAVFAEVPTVPGAIPEAIVIKLSKTDDQAALWNDYVMHTDIESKFIRIQGVNIPECYYFVPKNKAEWFKKRPGLEEAARRICNTPTCALVTERIWPLPPDIRGLLINKYCPPELKKEVLLDPANRECLVRPYLGSMHGQSTRRFFSLRNFKLHLNQMAEIQLNIGDLASRMGVTMAVMHWAAKTDARDVEFVLGSAKSNKHTLYMCPEGLKAIMPSQYTGPFSLSDKDFFCRRLSLWVLDFNQVRPITLDEAGVAKAVDAVKVNDPYLPKYKELSEASRAEMLVWNAFVTTYCLTSHSILKEEGHTSQEELALPTKFIQGLMVR